MKIMFKKSRFYERNKICYSKRLIYFKWKYNLKLKLGKC